MTTSITDARFTHLHATQGYITALLTDPSTEEDPDPWSVMPGYDQDLPVPHHLDPPRADHDDTLPSQIHPSYPYGRPGKGKGKKMPRAQPTNLLAAEARGERWTELNLSALLEPARGREVPPVMALRPQLRQPARSEHLERHLRRRDVTETHAPADQFDAPVPNETYADEDIEGGQVQRTPEG